MKSVLNWSGKDDNTQIKKKIKEFLKVLDNVIENIQD